MSSAHELFEAGRYDEALQVLQDEYAANPEDENAAYSLGTMHLWFGDAAAAQPLFDAAIKNHPKHSAANYQMAGIARWLLGDPTDAVTVWKAGVGCAYADGAGGMQIPLLLFFAAVRCPEACKLPEAEKLLKKLVKVPRSANWPGPLGRFVLGQINEPEIRRLAAEDPFWGTPLQLAQTDFYVGVLKLRDGDAVGYLESMRRCARPQPSVDLLDEFYLARHEAQVASDGRTNMQ